VYQGKGAATADVSPAGFGMPAVGAAVVGVWVAGLKCWVGGWANGAWATCLIGAVPVSPMGLSPVVRYVGLVRIVYIYGQNRIYIYIYIYIYVHAIYGLIFDEIPAKQNLHTTYIHGFGQPYKYGGGGVGWHIVKTYNNV